MSGLFNKLLCSFLVYMCISCTTWSKQDKVMMMTYTALNIIDIKQTREILSNDNYYEFNKILAHMTKDEATVYMIGTNVTLYLIVDKIKPKYRQWLLGSMCIVKFGLVANNFSVGFGVDF